MTQEQPGNKRLDITELDNKIPNSTNFLQQWIGFSPLEKRIFLIAKEYIKKHQVLDLQDLHVQSRRILSGSATPEAIHQSINRLISRRTIFEGGALTFESVLTNETRRQMYDLILVQPGINFSSIRATLNKDSKTVILYLKILEKFNLVRSEAIEKCRAYFDVQSPKEFDLFFFIIRKERVLDIMKAILDNPSSSVEDIDVILGHSISHQVLLRKIIMLVENKLIRGTLNTTQPDCLTVPKKYESLLKGLSIDSPSTSA